MKLLLENVQNGDLSDLKRVGSFGKSGQTRGSKKENMRTIDNNFIDGVITHHLYSAGPKWVNCRTKACRQN